MARGRYVGPAARRQQARVKSATPISNIINGHLLDLYQRLASHIDDVFQEHRLAYAFKDEDNADIGGKVPTVFVCVCKDGFERRNFNAHLRERLRAPFLEFLGEKETELKELIEN